MKVLVVFACLAVVALAAPQRTGSRPQFDNEFDRPIRPVRPQGRDCRYRCTMTACKLEKCHYDCSRDVACEQNVKAHHYSPGSIDQDAAASEVAPLITAKDEVTSAVEVPTAPATAPEPVGPVVVAAASAPVVDVVAAPLEAAESVPQQVIVVPEAPAPAVEAFEQIPAASEPIAAVEKAPVESGEAVAVPVIVASESAPAPVIVVEAPKAEEVDPIAQAAAAPLPSLSQVVEQPTIVSEAVEAAPAQKVAVPVIDTIAAAESVQIPVAIVPAEVAAPAQEKKDAFEVSKAEVAKEEEVKKVEIQQEEPIAMPSEAVPVLVAAPTVIAAPEPVVEKHAVSKGEEKTVQVEKAPEPAREVKQPIKEEKEPVKEVKPLGV